MKLYFMKKGYYVVQESLPLENLNIFFSFHSNITKCYEMIDQSKSC